jgi:hypothetical protein
MSGLIAFVPVFPETGGWVLTCPFPPPSGGWVAFSGWDGLPWGLEVGGTLGAACEARLQAPTRNKVAIRKMAWFLRFMLLPPEDFQPLTVLLVPPSGSSVTIMLTIERS